MVDVVRDARWLRAVLDSTAQAVLVLDQQGRIVLANRRCQELFGYSAEDLVERDASVLVPGVSPPVGLAAEERHEVTAVRSDATELPVEVLLSPVTAGEDPFVLATFRDGGERQGQQERFRSLLDAAPDATVIVDETAAILLANDQVEHVFGYRRAELIGQKIEVLVPERFHRVHQERRDGFLADPGVRPMGIGMDLYAVRKDGSEFPVEISLSPLETEEGVLVSAAVRDVTERRRIKEEAGRMREELIATVSHELRTPLTSIIGYAELLSDLGEGDLSAAARQMLEVIERNARRELRLVDDLLTVAFLGDRQLPVALALVDLVRVAEEAVDAARTLADSRGVALRLAPASTTWVSADLHRLGQVVDNLLTNAIKFTEAGGRVDVRVEADGADGAVLEVADTGTGMTEDEVSRIFERLYRTPAAVNNHVTGVGLGLPIVQAIVEAHAGSIEVDSAPGRGTRIRVRLPCAGISDPSAAPPG